ncbi:BTAD domain-containing putative transcriptional regulator [Actinomadura rudentiformis]|uniref:AfsR/SARP family transcriptional regulator n=1 Tax=Actinomadura rudentiformis TaxID=359158 RepID=A0A6H9YRG4_9ACTN|nr:BTAD domain-containing putative transcriptional regulator [Actinomadura rudentiformis]KAB2347911.1 AfsR/SARP family transcriptional regulator [Actinomadura rudentiformis]
MRFGVLGPLAVWTAEGGQVRIPEVKVRALLTQLLMNPGRVVPADRLIDVLWGENLPANPAASLQTRASQLRRVLDAADPGGRKLLVSQPPGYLLDVAPDAVDSGRFQLLVNRARAADSPQARADLLGEGLALWRGAALLDFADEEFARAERTRLDELRLTAWEELAEARLELGEHAMLADELGDLVARHPLRERLRAAHLRALYRAGRQSEAVSGYHELRERLAAELGVDPGREIAALYQSILEQDPSLGSPPAPAPRTNLPVPLTDLVGRAEAVRQIGALLDTGRLVTLTGPGGVGKTRLALETARRLTGRFPDGVWVVELVSANCEEAVAELVAVALGIRDESGEGLPARLAGALRGKRMLLILDNCEQVVTEAAELTAALLRTAPGLTVLATSQRPLGTTGELLWNVPPLAESSAVELFAARAAAGSPGFTVTPDNADAVAAICRRLDGLPLALELAATRVRVLGVHELASRLDDRFRVLGSGYGDAPARQRTLRAMIDWSWEPLGEDERTVLRRLAVHADGCTLEAVERVSGEDGLDVLDSLARLVDRSLVVVSSGTEGTRYRLLESVAAYCYERLQEAGEVEEIEGRHRRYYTELAALADSYLRGPTQREWLRRLDAETSNLRLALERGGGLLLVNSLAWYWVLRGRLGEGLRSLTAALAAVGTDDGSEDEAGTARVWRAAFSLRMGKSQDPAEPAVPPSRPADLAALTRRIRAESFRTLAYLAIGERTAEEQLATEVLEVTLAIGDRWGTAAALSGLARQALVRGDLKALAEDGRRSMELFTELGDQWGRVHATFALGIHAEITGDYAEAGRLHRDGLRMAEELGLWSEVSDRLSLLGRIALLNGDHARADELHERSSERAVEQGYTVGQEFAELGLALSYRRQGQLDEAEPLLRRWLAWNREVDSSLAQALILAELGFIAELRGDAETSRSLHEESLESARHAGDPRSMALAYEGLAGAAVAAGDHDLGARHLGKAAAIRDGVDAPLPPAERADVDRITAKLRAALGDETFAAQFAEQFAAGSGAIDEEA